jgi:flagellar biosynthesis protein FlhF
MKIKRYMAASMRLALDEVRVEQGSEAVILSSRRTPEGIEVIAAVDYDETLLRVAGGGRAPAPATATSVPEPTRAVEPAPAATPAPERPRAAAPPRAPAPSAPPRAAPSQAATPRAAPPRAAAPPRPMPDLGLLTMRREVQDLRHLLENGLANLGWSDRRRREPLKARVLEDLSALDIAPDVALRLASLLPLATRLQNPAHLPAALLARHLPVVPDLTAKDGGIVAVVGSTGVGKTTTIAKLAARWALRHGHEDLALVSTDGYRIGAREQLSTYARIIGAPMYAANSGKELAQVLARLKAKKLILIDTAGMGPRDGRLAEQLAALHAGAARARLYLALPAQGEARALEDMAHAFMRLAPVACILTKIDEAASLGAALSTAMRHRLPIAYFCNGQRVPEDLHAAFTRRVWLVRAAMRLRQGAAAPPRDEQYLARHFGRGQIHAAR